MRSRGGLIIAGLCAAALAFPAFASAAPGDIYVADYYHLSGPGAVLKVGPTGGAPTPFAVNNAEFVDPWGMVMDRDGGLLVADYGANKIFRVSSSGVLSPFFSTPSQAALTDLAWGPDGKLYVLDYVTKNIIRLDPKTLSFSVVATNAGVPEWTSGNSLVVARDLTIYFTTPAVDAVFMVSTAGAVSKLYQGSLLSDPVGLVLSPDENSLYVADNVTHQVVRIDRRTAAAAPFADFGAGTSAFGIAQVRDGSFLVTDPGNGLIRRVGPTGPPATTFSEGAGYGDPMDMVQEPSPCAGKLPTVVGTDARDVIRGSKFADVISVLGGNDVVRGLQGKDTICGGKGRDKLIGGKGKDRLIGGKGKDVQVP